MESGDDLEKLLPEERIKLTRGCKMTEQEILAKMAELENNIIEIKKSVQYRKEKKIFVIPEQQKFEFIGMQRIYCGLFSQDKFNLVFKSLSDSNKLRKISMSISKAQMFRMCNINNKQNIFTKTQLNFLQENK